MWQASDFAIWLQEQDAAGAWAGLEYDENETSGAMNGAVGFDAQVSSRPVSGCGDIWNKVIVPRIRRVLLYTLLCGQDVIGSKMDAKLCFEQYGFDVMIDATLRVWLIEVNSAPDMTHSTKVTAELVPEASEGMVAVLQDVRAWERGGKCGPEPDTHGWERLYRAPLAAEAAPSCTAGGIALVGRGLAGSTSRARSASNPAPAAHSAAAASSKPPQHPIPGGGLPPRASVPAAKVLAAKTALPRVATLVRRVRSVSGTGARAVRALATTASLPQPQTFTLKAAAVGFAPPLAPAPSLREAAARAASMPHAR
jgi:hypothetical protein